MVTKSFDFLKVQKNAVSENLKKKISPTTFDKYFVVYTKVSVVNLCRRHKRITEKAWMFQKMETSGEWRSESCQGKPGLGCVSS